MRRSGGYLLRCGPDGTRENDSFTCGHCQYVTFVRPFADAADFGGLCKSCMKNICKRCVTRGICDPWEKQMDAIEAKGRVEAGWREEVSNLAAIQRHNATQRELERRLEREHEKARWR